VAAPAAPKPSGEREEPDPISPRRTETGCKPMTLYVGTSGFSYKQWKGPFYPEKLPAKAMLEYYGTQLPAVEINNTFYRMPKQEVFENWAAQVPETFRFAVKASRRITHFKRLNDTDEVLDYLLTGAAVLGDRLGVLLFQLPPHFKVDVERLKAFLASLPRDVRAAFEFRHDSWRDEEVLDALRDHGAALVIADTDDEDADIISTTSWGYLRLRKSDYTDKQVAAWTKKVEAQAWDDAFVFFKHEDAGIGPLMAKRFLAAGST
jgi:uncharacterized protein YecE (DUF72 family)